METSHEPTEQDQPRFATAAETDQSSVVQGNSAEAQFPVSITSGPVSSDPNEIVTSLLSWIFTPNWSTSQIYLQSHPELLTETATQVLAMLTQPQLDKEVYVLFVLHQQLLRIAGQQGVEAAYQALLYQKEKNDSAATEQEELQAQVITWLQTPDWKTSQTYLRSHPQLLTDVARQMLEVLKRSQRDQQAQSMINLHQALLQKARLEGIEAAYEHFPISESETPPSDQEVATYQSLQNTATLNNAGIKALRQYDASGQVAYLNRALECWHEAFKLTPLDSPDRPAMLNNLGTGLRVRYERSGGLVDLEAAISAWERSWFIPHIRFSALPVAYQLGQQRQGAWVASALVTAYLEQAKQRYPRTLSAPRRALEIAEGSKSRLLTQLVGRGSLPLPLGLSPEIAAQELQFLADLTTLDTEELAIHDHFVPTQEKTNLEHARQLEEMQRRQNELAQQRLQQRRDTLLGLEELLARIAHVGPEGTAYVALRRGAAPTWQELVHLAKALGPATVLLSFFTTNDRTLFFLLRAGWRVPRVVEVPLNHTSRANLLERFFREVRRYRPGLHRSVTWDLPLRPLFTKAQHHLEGGERLILAPAGSGHLLPWGVLAERAGWHTSAGQPLPLVTLPALGILPRLRQRPHVPPGPALVIGNPRGDLPSAEVEAKLVAERLGTKPLLGIAANKSAVLTRLADATLIHLATHAFFDANNPLESGIALSDGVLTAREVLQHRLQADMLVLSACESGQVGYLGGDELAGLSQAFLQAGVRSLLVSLWQVNDPATAALMEVFYTAREAGADKALALRQAMTQVQLDPRWTHPYYWGAFVLIGDWD